MSQAAASAWWDDVQYLREAAERREATASRRHLSVAGDEDFADVGEDAPSAAPRAQRPARRAREDERAPGAPRAQRPARREPVRLEDSVQTRRLRASEPRRTVQITGRIEAGVDTGPPTARDRGRRRAGMSAGNIGARPDRIAMWAVILGLFLVLVAAISSDSASAATLLTAGV